MFSDVYGPPAGRQHRFEPGQEGAPIGEPGQGIRQRQLHGAAVAVRETDIAHQQDRQAEAGDQHEQGTVEVDGEPAVRRRP